MKTSFSSLPAPTSSGLAIEVNNLTRRRVKKEFLIKFVKNILRKDGKGGAGLSIALVGGKRMKFLNKRYRGKNRATDVLVFSQNQKFPIVPESELGLGEILICLSEVAKNAEIMRITFEKELARVLIHGVLHLLGYDHEKGEQKAKLMRKKEEYYLAKNYKK